MDPSIVRCSSYLQTQHSVTHLRALLERLQLEECRRLAQDLHDSTPQELAILNWIVTRLSSLVDDKHDALKKLVQERGEIALQCRAKIRNASYLQLPPVLGEAGSAVAIPSMLEEFEQRSRIHVRHDLGRFSKEAGIAIYPVLQEGLSNVLWLGHSGRHEVADSVRRKLPWLEPIVREWGRKLMREAILDAWARRNGTGIGGMRRLLEPLGGFLKIDCRDVGQLLTAVVTQGGE
jgi:two-component system NarL family sensor kinase